MPTLSLQDTLAITYRNASTKDKLGVVFGEILKNIRAKADYVDLINTNYSDSPVKGGTVHIDRIAFATVRNYLTAHGNGAGDTPQNNGLDILVNIDKEIITEVPKKDARLWRGDESEILAATYMSQSDALQIFLDDAYFVALQTAAVTYSVSSVTDSDATKQKILRLLALIRKLESVTSENINKIDRSQMVLTLSPEVYDSLESYMTALTNPQGNNIKTLHRVEVRPALRQDVDAVIQIRGAMGMPMVIDRYTVAKPPYKNALVQELYFSYGLDEVYPEAIFKAAISADDDISI